MTVTRVSHGRVMARQARGEVAGLEAELRCQPRGQGGGRTQTELGMHLGL